ncbi:hypothetical protein CDAR_454271 [Caerostris darwini]|uniref:Uncharacterized protein n=1 Tax=Caerostris darwini TaxID=1538125 RepID=A0AAV4V719_9ARAC|nr:hypothetical protein CDAR_454271 [Caerostris darwini]
MEKSKNRRQCPMNFNDIPSTDNSSRNNEDAIGFLCDGMNGGHWTPPSHVLAIISSEFEVNPSKGPEGIPFHSQSSIYAPIFLGFRSHTLKHCGM